MTDFTMLCDIVLGGMACRRKLFILDGACMTSLGIWEEMYRTKNSKNKQSEAEKPIEEVGGLKPLHYSLLNTQLRLL